MDDSSDPPSRRARKKAATRRRITESAFALFLERGYDAVTVEAICEAADVARRTFFLHFPTKDALLVEYGREATDALAASLAGWRGGAAGALRHALAFLAERASRSARTVELIVREVTASPGALQETASQQRSVQDLLAEVVRAGQHAGELRRGVAPELAAAVLVSAYFTLSAAWAQRGAKDDLAAWMRQATDLVLSGLRAPEEAAAR